MAFAKKDSNQNIGKLAERPNWSDSGYVHSLSCALQHAALSGHFQSLISYSHLELVESTDGESEYHEAASHIAFDEDDEDDENEGYGEEQDTGVNADGSPTTPQQDQLQVRL